MIHVGEAFTVMLGVLSLAIVIFIGIGWLGRYTDRKLDEYDARLEQAKSKMTTLNDEGYEE